MYHYSERLNRLTRPLQHIGDTKAGIFVGADRFGNKYFENSEELPRT